QLAGGVRQVNNLPHRTGTRTLTMPFLCVFALFVAIVLNRRRTKGRLRRVWRRTMDCIASTGLRCLETREMGWGGWVSKMQATHPRPAAAPSDASGRLHSSDGRLLFVR